MTTNDQMEKFLDVTPNAHSSGFTLRLSEDLPNDLLLDMDTTKVSI